MLVGLMPVNLGGSAPASEVSGNASETPSGEKGMGRSVGDDGESFIALSLSCDGVHWSELTPLVWTMGSEGRTWDHPVDGLLLEGGEAHFMVQMNVGYISPDAGPGSRIVKYRLKRAALRKLTLDARKRLVGCATVSGREDTSSAAERGALLPHHI